MKLRFKQKRTLLLAGFLLMVFSLPPVSAAEISDQGMSLNLSLQQAIDDARHNNVMLKIARQRIDEAKGRRWQNDSDLMPHISFGASQGRVFWDNFASQGIPSFGVIGPFNSFDARFRITQRIFDLSALSRFQASNVDVDIAGFEEQLARQQVVTAAVIAYLDVLQAQEQLKAVREDVRLAQKLASLAQHQLEAGIVTNLDLVRAQTSLALQKAKEQERIQALNSSFLSLKRVIGLPLSTELKMSEALRFFDERSLAVTDAVNAAGKDRLELSIAASKVKYEQDVLSMANRQRLPKLDFYGDYGQSAVEPNKYAHQAAQIAVNLSMPIFEGGLIEGQIRQQKSRKAQAETLYADMQTQVEEDVRLALQTLSTAAELVKASGEALRLSDQELGLARDQYSNGVGNNVAVVDAQTTLENSRQSYVTALVQYHMARINYYSALGRTESFHL